MAGKIPKVVWYVPPGKPAVKKQFVGSWRITELEGFDSGYVDLCGPAKLEITARGGGHFHFGAVEAGIDCKMDGLDGRVVRFTFEGGDEGDPICGRGFCQVNGDQMAGRFYRHLGDDFAFQATRIKKGAGH